MVMVALQPKVHIMKRNGLFLVHRIYGDDLLGSVECGVRFLMHIACWMAYGQAVHPTRDLAPLSMTIALVTSVLLTCLATPFSCGVSGLVFLWMIPMCLKYWMK